MIIDNIVQNIIQESFITISLSLIVLYSSQIYKRSFFFSVLIFSISSLLINIIPIHRGSSVVEIIRGAIGDISISSGLIMACVLYNTLKETIQNKEGNSFISNLTLIVVFTAGCILYLSTFGFIEFDVYSLGYLSPLMLAIIGIITLLLIIFNNNLGIIYLISLVCFTLHLQASNNIWDYIIDPLQWIAILSVLISRIAMPNHQNKQNDLI